MEEEFVLSQLTAWSPFFQRKAKKRRRSLLNAKKVRRWSPGRGSSSVRRWTATGW